MVAGGCLNFQNDCCGVSTESGSDRVTILEILNSRTSGDPVATALGTDLILKLRHHRWLDYRRNSSNSHPVGNAARAPRLRHFKAASAFPVFMHDSKSSLRSIP